VPAILNHIAEIPSKELPGSRRYLFQKRARALLERWKDPFLKECVKWPCQWGYVGGTGVFLKPIWAFRGEC